MSRRIGEICLFLFLCAITGCGSRPKVEGVVLDNFGKPVSDAKVMIAGTTLAAKTGRDGRYAVPFVPGQFTVRYESPGHVAEERSFTIASEVSVPAEAVTLLRLPPKPGIWLVETEGYAPIAQGLVLECIEQQRATQRMFSVDTSPTLLHRPPTPGGAKLVFVDNLPGRQLLLRGSLGMITQPLLANPETGPLVEEKSRAFGDVLVRETSLESGFYSFISIEDDRRWGWRPSETGFALQILAPGQSAPVSAVDKGTSAWPTLKPGETKQGLSVTRKGFVTFKGQPLGRLDFCSPSALRVSRPSARKGYLYVVLWDGDHGGTEAYVVDPREGSVRVRGIVQKFRPEGYSYPVENRVGPEIFWSPDERYAVTPDIGEVQDHINVIDLEGRRSTHLSLGHFERNECDAQVVMMNGSRWRSATEFVFRVDVAENPWSDIPCPDRAQNPQYEAVVNVETLAVDFERKS